MGSCTSCHNGNIATGKPGDHLATTLECDFCHIKNAWLPATFDHSDVINNCSSCHDGNTATGKDAQHILSTQTCEACHSPLTWSPVITTDHNNVLGSCTSCHDGNIATGPDNGHFITSLECDSCHSIQNWNFSNYVHSGSYPGEHRTQLDCIDCHTNNSEIIPWKFPYGPDCAGCHANDYEADEHKKTESPVTIFYTVSELRDCSGACHEYTDNSFTTIEKNLNSEHRVSDSEFD